MIFALLFCGSVLVFQWGLEQYRDWKAGKDAPTPMDASPVANMIVYFLLGSGLLFMIIYTLITE